jgi:hypothetical protein
MFNKKGVTDLINCIAILSLPNLDTSKAITRSTLINSMQILKMLTISIQYIGMISFKKVELMNQILNPGYKEENPIKKTLSRNQYK